MFLYSIVSYAIVFASILYWILSVSNLIPEISIDQPAKASIGFAILNNIFLVSLFGIQHSIMARKWFKDFFTSYFPKPVERSTFVLISGLLLFLLVYQWQPIGGMIWKVEAGSVLYYTLYVLFFMGWAILFISTFLINHFDLFGLRQTFLELQNKPYTELQFKVVSFYKHVRHPLYSGMLLGVWATPVMSITHLTLAIGLTIYVIIGISFEEKDLIKEFGNTYQDYKKGRPMLIPTFRAKNK